MPNAQTIMQYAFGFVPSLAVSAAVDLGVFAALSEGPRSLEQLAQACQCQPRGLSPLLHTLVSLGLLLAEPTGWSLSEDSRTFLVPSSPAYLGGMLTHQTHLVAQWVHLPQTIRAGTSQQPPVEGDEDAGEFFAAFVDSLFNLNFPAAGVVAEKLAAQGPIASALDIGCGSGVWSLALAQKLPDLQVLALDRPTVLDKVTDVFARRLGVRERYTLKGGNFRELDFGQQDVVYLGHILHSEGEALSRTLLGRCFEALRPGGRLVVAEMVASEPRGEALFPNLFDLNMLMWTQEGTVFTASQLEAMGREAGFSGFEWVPIPGPSPVLIATR